jgi:hypothetical protein
MWMEASLKKQRTAASSFLLKSVQLTERRSTSYQWYVFALLCGLCNRRSTKGCVGAVSRGKKTSGSETENGARYGKSYHKGRVWSGKLAVL